MRYLSKLSILSLVVTILLCMGSVDGFAQKKKKNKKKKKEKTEKVVKKTNETIKETKEIAREAKTAADALLDEEKGLWGATEADSLEAVKNYSLYREFYKQGSYEDALPYWRYIYKNIPAARKTPLMDGEKMYRNYLEKQLESCVCKSGEIPVEDPAKMVTYQKECKNKGGFIKWKYKDEAKAQAYMDTINMIYDTRVKHFSQKGFLLAKKSQMLSKFYPQERDKIFDLREKSIEIEAEDSDPVTVYYYFNSLMGKLSNKEITSDQLATKYDMLSDIMDYNIENNSNDKQVEKYQKYGERMESKMDKILSARENALSAAKNAAAKKAAAKAMDCPSIKSHYGAQLSANPNDLQTVKIYYSKLKKAGCKSDPAFLEVLLKWQSLEPSASRARYIAQTYQKQKNYAKAVEFYNKSLDLESDASKKAKTYMSLAKIEQVANSNYIKAREYAQKAAAAQAGWGDPYIFIGNLYLRSKSQCNSDGLGGASVYWVAYDMFAKANDIDPSSVATGKMSDARRGFPSKENLFMSKGVQPGSRFKVGCWINQNTTVK